MKYFLLLFAIIVVFACSSNEQFYSMDDYPDVKKIDTHVHLETERRTFMDKARADNFRIINVSLETKNGWTDVYRKYRYGNIQKDMYPDLVETVTAFSVNDWDEVNWEEKVITWLDSCFQEGALGVKVWKNIGMVSRDSMGNLIKIDDPKFDPIFAYIKDQGKTLMGHLGEPKNCWLPLDSMTTNNDRNYFERNPQYHMFKHPDMPSYEDQIASRDRMLERNPELPFVGAHVGSIEWSVDELAKRLNEYPNMSVDLAARMGQIFYQTALDREKVRDFFIEYQDRILYATDLADHGKLDQEQLYQRMDNNWKRDWRFFVTDETMKSDLIDSEFKSLKLPASVVDKIFYENAIHWFGIKI